jgi:hypothetical protein
MSNEYKMELIKQSFAKTQIGYSEGDFDEMLKEEQDFAQFIDIICDAMQTFLENKGIKPQAQRQPKHFEDDGAYAD